MLQHLLMRDAEQPAAKSGLVAQDPRVFHRRDEGFLHQIQTELFLARELKNINMQRQLIAPEQGFPSRVIPPACA